MKKHFSRQFSNIDEKSFFFFFLRKNFFWFIVKRFCEKKFATRKKSFGKKNYFSEKGICEWK